MYVKMMHMYDNGAYNVLFGWATLKCIHSMYTFVRVMNS